MKIGQVPTVPNVTPNRPGNSGVDIQYVLCHSILAHSRKCYYEPTLPKKGWP